VAATVLLSTLAALVATRTEQEMPTFNAPADRSEQEIAVAPAQRAQLEAPSTPAPAAAGDAASEKNAAAPSTAPPVAQVPSAPREQRPVAPPAKPSDGRLATGTPASPPPAPEVGSKLGKTIAPSADTDATVRSAEEARTRGASQPAAEPVAREKVNVANEADARAAEAQGVEAKRRAFPGAASGSLQSAPGDPAPLAPPPAAPPAAGVAAAPQSQSAGHDQQATVDSVKREQAFGERAAARRDAPAPVVGAMRQEAPKESVAKDYEASADAWFEVIIRMRRDGRHDEADAELKRLRERYPDVRVPPAALRPTATR
jgi:hypothetical protein